MKKIFPTLENIQRLKQKPTNGEWFLLNYLINDASNREIEIYFQPFLNGDRPDIILLQKGVGATVIEVKDWSLNSYSVDEDNQWSLQVNQTEIKSPFQQVYYYKDQLFNLHIEGLLEKKLKNKNFYGRIKPYVYFHGVTQKDINYFRNLAIQTIKSKQNIYHENYKNKKISEREYNENLEHLKNKIKKITRDFDYVALTDDTLHKLCMPSPDFKNLFTDDIYNEFCRLLQPPLHTLEEGKKIPYTKKQIRLMGSSSSSAMKIKGVAGSGKTIVLAKRAVNAHRRHNNLVLILTFNLTLVNYIHDKISDVRDDFNWGNFYITNYHSFFRTAMKNTSMNKNKTNFSDYDNIKFFNGYEKELRKYKTILIDEIQDFKAEWIKIIRDYFLDDGGEIVLFGDEKQNIYERALDTESKIKVPNGFGRWETLKTSIRFQGDGGRVLNLTKKFQQGFLKGKYIIDEEEVLPTQSFLNIGIFHAFANYESDEESIYKIAEHILQQIKDNNIHPDDVVILSSQIEVLRLLDYCLRNDLNQDTITSFETEEYYKIIHKKFINSEKEQIELNTIRRNKKRHFYFHNGKIKVSTIHSFKGAEAQTVFLLINSADDTEMIYTGITRSKFNLMVFLPAESKFNEFFTRELIQIKSGNIKTKSGQAIFEELRIAVSNKKIIDFDYAIHGKEVRQIDVKPYKILFMNDNYYLACEVDNGYKFSMFRISKISNLTIRNEEFYYDIDIQNFVSDIQTPFSKYTDNYKNNMVDVVVEVDATKAHFFELKKFLPSQTIEETLSNGNLIISYKVTQELEIEDIIKKWLPYVKVLEPISLDEKIRVDIQRYLEAI